MKLLTQKLIHARNQIDTCRQQLRARDKIGDSELKALDLVLAAVAEEIQSVLTDWSIGNYDNEEERENEPRSKY